MTPSSGVGGQAPTRGGAAGASQSKGGSGVGGQAPLGGTSAGSGGHVDPPGELAGAAGDGIMPDDGLCGAAYLAAAHDCDAGAAKCEAPCALPGDAQALTEWLLPFDPSQVAMGSLGSANPNQVWVTADTQKKALLFDVTTAAYDVYDLKEFPGFVAPSIDGALWFTGSLDGAQLQCSFDADTKKEVRIGVDTAPRGITVGADGNHWFCQGNNVIERDAQGVALRTLALDDGSDCYDLELASNGSLWAVDQGIGPSLWRMLPGDPKRVAQFENTMVLRRIASTSDALWLTALHPAAAHPGRVLQVSFEGKVLTSYQLPPTSSDPWGIVAGPDDNLWFTDRYAWTVNRLSPAGELTSFVIPGLDPNPRSTPNDITVGPDGRIWFTEQSAKKLGAIAP